MKIAVLGWGSLISEPGGVKVARNFEPTGPRLPIEFSRISNGGRLTLVIHESVGAVCATYAAPSALDDLDHALENLWTREGRKDATLPGDIRKSGRVAFVDRLAGRRNVKAMERHQLAVETIDDWVAANGYDAAIWTALDSNFRDQTGESFSVEAAVRYLAAQHESTLHKALSYIRRAPDEVQTPVRAAVNVRWPEG